MTLSEKIKPKEKKARRMASVIEHLSNKCKALSSNPGTTSKKERKKERTKERKKERKTERKCLKEIKNHRSKGVICEVSTGSPLLPCLPLSSPFSGDRHSHFCLELVPIFL
jgi:hypothetical protein